MTSTPHATASAHGSAATAGSIAAARAIGSTIFVLGVAAATGFLTPYASVHLPSSVSVIANSSGPWAMVAFASVFLSNARGSFAAILGAASFLVMNVFFYFAFVARLGPYPHDTIAFWVGVSVMIGPILGLCASWLRSRIYVLREIGVAAPASILIGEGLFMAIAQPGLSPVYSHLSIGVGITLFAVLAVWRLRRVDRIAISALMCAAATALYYAAYALMPVVFGLSAP